VLRVRNWCANFETHESRKLKRLDWVSVPNDLLDLQYRILVDHPDGAAHFGAWIAIVEVASTCKIRGTLLEGGVSLSKRHLSLKSGLPVSLFDSVIPRLLDTGWLEEIPDSEETPPAIPGEIPGGPEDFRQEAGKSSAYSNRDIDTYKDSKPICASGDAREGGLALSIDEPPFETTEPGALFPAEPKRPAKVVDGLTPQQDIWFGIWWASYWLRKSRKAARQTFGKQVKSVGRFEQVMAATQAQTAEMVSREPQHRPHGATWLHQERWEDEAATDAPVKRTERAEALDRMYASLEKEQGEKGQNE
jgi:hypothetical protein